MTTLVRSRYLLVSPHAYRGPDGRTIRMAYATRQARLFPVDEDTAAALSSGDLARIEAPQLARLRSLQAVVDRDEDELAEVLGGYRSGSTDPGARGFTIMPTSYCNMACDYCGQEHYKAAVDERKVERTTARVLAAIADPGTRGVSVTWFGGEPLLALRVVRQMSHAFVAAADAAGKPYSARMPTNGSLLTARTLRVLHDECRLTALEVTIDGPEKLHDQRRVKRNGIGSFHRTMAVLGQAVRDGSVPRTRISIRVNVDVGNEDSVDDLLVDLACCGLSGSSVEVHLMPVHSWGNDVSAVEVEARRFAAREIDWLRRARLLGLGFAAPPKVVRRTTCRATSAYGEIIDSAGRVYSCSEHPLVPGARDTGVVATLADLAGSAPRPTGSYDDWYDQVGDSRQQCGRCPLLPVCGGSCPKLWREGHVPCPSMRHNWAGRLDLEAERLGLRPVEAG